MVKISFIKIQSIPSTKKEEGTVAQAHEEIRKKKKDFIPTESAGFP